MIKVVAHLLSLKEALNVRSKKIYKKRAGTKHAIINTTSQGELSTTITMPHQHS